MTDLTVSVPVPAGSKSRDLIVDIKKKSLKVALKGKGPEGVIIDGELPKEIKVDDSTWTLGELAVPLWRPFGDAPAPAKLT